MNTSWTDPVYPLPRGPRWLRRWRQALRCYFHFHVLGVPQRRDARDLGRSAGPCRHCGGEHLWRDGKWVATRHGKEAR